MIDVISDELRSYQAFRESLVRRLSADLREAYPDLFFTDESLPEKLDKTGDRFIFIIDEWDAVFEASFMTEADRQSYVLFLKSLLKDKKYVHFVYMTGILPIAKYSSGSSLNMFHEFSAFEDAIFYPYFGLTEAEISDLMMKRELTIMTRTASHAW